MDARAQATTRARASAKARANKIYPPPTFLPARAPQKLHATESTIFLELYCIGGNAVIALETSIAGAVLEQTLQQYRIPDAASPELLALDQS